MILPCTCTDVADSGPRVYHHYSQERVLTPPKDAQPFAPSGTVMSLLIYFLKTCPEGTFHVHAFTVISSLLLSHGQLLQFTGIPIFAPGFCWRVMSFFLGILYKLGSLFYLAATAILCLDVMILHRYDHRS